MKLNDNITVLKNIGDQRKTSLNKIKITDIESLLNYYPRTYDDRSEIISVSEIEDGTRVSLKVTITSKCESFNFGKLSIQNVSARDESGFIKLVWFNQPYLKNNFVKGDIYSIYGKAIFKQNKMQVEVIEYEKFNDLNKNVNSLIVPIYTLPKGLSQKIFRNFIFDALKETELSFNDFFSNEILNKYNLSSLSYAIKNIHFPKTNSDFYKARDRLVFNELFLMQGALFSIKNFAKKENEIIFTNLNDELIKSKLKFNLTNGQKKVLDELKSDFTSGFNMNRLIQGDVGCGKTAVALIASFISIQNGYQSVLMAPTEVLARQHFDEIKKIFESLKIETVILSGSLKKKEKSETLEKIKNGTAQMIIGTHALIQESVSFFKLGLAIADEQHRFGVRQRGILSQKEIKKNNQVPHFLVMTATPIPRTLGLILYGDLDISVIDELPPGRQKIDTFVVNKSYYTRLCGFIKKEVDNNSQVYIVCPAIEENENIKMSSVIKYASELENDLGINYKIKYLHGKMKQQEKDEIMNDFKENKFSILVSTTVIEVGVNVPNATVMIIEDAHRFGLSALHQLRGRVGRGKKKSYCILVSDAKSKVTKKRLSAMEKTNDGFVLSEEDLKLRGHGDFFGNRQHGLPEFKISNLYQDVEILKKCQLLWFDIQNKNCTFENENLINEKIKEYLNLEDDTVYL